MKREYSVKGFTLVEIVSALVLVTIVFTVAAVSIYAFFYKFKELLLVSEFSEEIYEVVEGIKYGIKLPTQNDEFEFLGLASSVEFELSSPTGDLSYYRRIKCKSLALDVMSVNDYVSFYFDPYSKTVKYDYLRGFLSGRYITLFPSKKFEDIVKVNKFGFQYVRTDKSKKTVSLVIDAVLELNKDPQYPKSRRIQFNTIISLAD
ncbi:MAG: type II secretion system protein [Candidatus Cloacimonetes bacterium]|nr:type II secretion system protein [Candidatus Cloacimonadota bacterium]